MGTIVHIDCEHCGGEIPFEVEEWASPPERAYCGQDCYEQRGQAQTVAATTS